MYSRFSYQLYSNINLVKISLVKSTPFQGKRGFGSKRVILFSDVGGEFGDDNLNDIIASMKEAEIELNVMYVTRDDVSV